uniref:Uncharacterized protein n=1 Tax=Chromera velia CCMP2878 TaxID=1169474 RepID=A0A0G4HY29_9ALVE|eukprot:Cvel_1524.t1-p1 / transcript=Cvel_1524.t1 / gene=Cvel_1524 / organism=Chromera_velia_CCMP2878 / gene_product=Putative ankyrin repeat protein MM_0045, putative / transcript_product=Putative ankyrin repeat protein MM_0045, putative / location=Cvel_scaffold53:155441-156850(+) / protein_length=470 / sequence_SO=supercontig / SO=protein_coding / is_pseudo=false
MEETSLLTTEGYLKLLKTAQASIISELEACFRYQVELVEKTLRAEGPGENSAAASVPQVRIEDIAVLDRLENASKDFSKTIKEQLGEVVYRHFQIDAGFLYQLGIGETIRAFVPVSAKICQRALSDFLSGANNGDDFRICLKAGADVNGLFEGQTALIRAVCGDNREAVEMILANGGDLEVKAGNDIVVSGDDEELVAGDTALMAACQTSRWGMIEFLVAEGANVNEAAADGKKALQIACEVADEVLDQNRDPAVRSSISRALKALLEKTSAVANLKIYPQEDWPESLVHFFPFHEFEELLRLSLSRGVDVNELDGNGSTALMIAVDKARPEYVQILVDNGANVNERYEGKALVHLAIPQGARLSNPRMQEQNFISSVQAVLEILINAGADVNAKTDEWGSRRTRQTALHLAVEWGVTDVVRFLVERGADLQIWDHYGRNPYVLAWRFKRNLDILRLLGHLIDAPGLSVN